MDATFARSIFPLALTAEGPHHEMSVARTSGRSRAARASWSESITRKPISLRILPMVLLPEPMPPARPMTMIRRGWGVSRIGHGSRLIDGVTDGARGVPLAGAIATHARSTVCEPCLTTSSVPRAKARSAGVRSMTSCCTFRGNHCGVKDAAAGRDVRRCQAIGARPPEDLPR